MRRARRHWGRGRRSRPRGPPCPCWPRSASQHDHTPRSAASSPLDYREALESPRAAARELATIWRRAFSIHVHGLDGARDGGLGGHLSGGTSDARRGLVGPRRSHRGRLLRVCRLRADPARAARATALMAERDKHAHPTTSRKVLVAVGGQDIDEETVRLACRMTDPQGGRLYGVHIIEVNRSLPLGAVLDDVVERGEQILDEVDEAVEWGADLIVMGLPYKRRFGEFNLGKTVPYVLKNANCRVMLFREHREHREGTP